MTTLAELQAQLLRQTRQRFARNAGRSLIYVAMGASDAVGVGATTPSNGYVERIAARLRSHFATTRAVVVHNLGVSGYTLGDIVQYELPSVAALRPDLVTLWAGANDVMESADSDEFREQLTRLLATVQRSGAELFVATVPDLSLVPMIRSFPPWLMPLGDAGSYARRRSRELGEIVVRLVPVYAGHLVNLPLTEILAHPNLVAMDGFHPSDAGYARLADAWWQEISRLLD